MILTPWRKRGGDLAVLRDEMDRMFERFGEPWGLIEPKVFRTEGWFPLVDVSETDTEFTVRAEAPGIPAKDLEISVNGNSLVLSGTKAKEEEKKGEGFYRCERSFGEFRRVIDLPDTVDAEKVTAEADNGVLTVHLAKKPGAKTRKVEVRPVSGSRKVSVS